MTEREASRHTDRGHSLVYMALESARARVRVCVGACMRTHIRACDEPHDDSEPGECAGQRHGAISVTFFPRRPRSTWPAPSARHPRKDFKLRRGFRRFHQNFSRQLKRTMPRWAGANSAATRVMLCGTVLACCARVCCGGASAYLLLGDLAEELDREGAIVEVGSDRGEGSTVFLSALANRTGRPFFSVDFSDEGFRNARAACGSCAQQGMGERWLEDAQGFASAAAAAGLGEQPRIALAYLDNYDWTYPWTKAMSYKLQQHKDYQDQGLSLSNAKSQETHLRQAKAVEQRCTERCVVLFDDTWAGAAPGLYNGKGGQAVGFLLGHGFEVVQQSAADEPSHLGWVLLRRLPSAERVVLSPGEEDAAAGVWSALRMRTQDQRGAADAGGVGVEVISPMDGAVVHGGRLDLTLSVRRALPGEHTLVVYNDNVEVLRIINWEDFREVSLPLCRLRGGGEGAAGGKRWAGGSGRYVRERRRQRRLCWVEGRSRESGEGGWERIPFGHRTMSCLWPFRASLPAARW